MKYKCVHLNIMLYLLLILVTIAIHYLYRLQYLILFQSWKQKLKLVYKILNTILHNVYLTLWIRWTIHFFFWNFLIGFLRKMSDNKLLLQEILYSHLFLQLLLLYYNFDNVYVRQYCSHSTTFSILC